MTLADDIERAERGEQKLDDAIVLQVSNCAMMNPPAYTTSIDAAMSLVPEGWSYGTGNGPSGAWAWIAPDDEQTWVEPEALIKATTPALALCAAALRAKAQADG